MTKEIEQGKLALCMPEPNHYYAPGVVAREITLPKGSCVIGKIHKQSHINIISYGRVLVVTEFGKEEYVGPCTFISPVGVKRVVWAKEATLWTCIHPSDATNPEDLEEEVIAKKYADIPAELIGSFPLVEYN